MSYDCRIEIGTRTFVIKPNETAYDSEEMFPGGPRFKYAERTEDGLLKDGMYPSQPPFDNVFLLHEDELWIPGDTLRTISNGRSDGTWRVYPFRLALAKKLGPQLLAEILESTRIAIPRPGTSEPLTAQLNWRGVALSRSYGQLLTMPVGIAVWPPRIVKDWKNFYVLVAPGSEKAASAGLPKGMRVRALCSRPAENVFSEATVNVDESGQQPQAFFLHGSSPIRVLSFAGEDLENGAGLLPLEAADDGEYTSGGKRLGSLDGEHAPGQVGTAVLCVDFGTTNTAVGVSEDGADPRLLEFDSTARILTDGLDPFYIEKLEARFVREKRSHGNPFPTLLWEQDQKVGAKDAAGALAELFFRRSVPALRFDAQGGERNLLTLTVGALKELKQDFKWKEGADGERHMKAFLGQVGLMTAYALRSREECPANVDVVFTAPLAFSRRQASLVSVAFNDFAAVLRHCAVPCSGKPRNVSESWANAYWANAAGLGGADAAVRHLVIDVGGGTADISVFRRSDNKPAMCFLDSLGIGGKDVTHSLVPAKVDRDHAILSKIVDALHGGEPLKKLVNARPETRGDLLQTVFLRELGIKRPDEIHEAFRSAEADDVLAETAALLSFVVSYGVVLASLPCDGKMESKAGVKQVIVYLCGLGSKLLELSPLPISGGGGYESFVSVTTAIVGKVMNALGLVEPEIVFPGPPNDEGKRSVCLGGCLARTSSDDLPEDMFEMKTVRWFECGGDSPLAWTEAYRRGDLPKESGLVAKAEATALGILARDVVDRWGALHFENWPGRRAVDRDKLPQRLSELFQLGIQEALKEREDGPAHPLGYVVSHRNGLKRKWVPDTLDTP